VFLIAQPAEELTAGYRTIELRPIAVDKEVIRVWIVLLQKNIECDLYDVSNKWGNTKKIKCQKEHYADNHEEETGSVRTYL